MTLLFLIYMGTLTKHSGALIEGVTITKVDGNLIYYRMSGSEVERVLSRLAVARIDFDDGTSEEFDRPTTIVVTEDRNLVEGLVFLGTVDAVSLWGGVVAQDLGRNSVDKKLREQAVKLGGCAVLTTRVTSSLGGASGNAEVYGTAMTLAAAKRMAEFFLEENRFLSSKLVSALKHNDGGLDLEYKARNRGYPKYYDVRRAMFRFVPGNESGPEILLATKKGDWVSFGEWGE